VNLDALWQRNRKFILILLGSVLGFFILLWMLTSSSVGRQKAAGLSLAKANGELRSANYGDKQEREAQAQLETLRARNAEFAAKALPPVRAEYQLPKGKAAAQHYIELTGALRQDLVGWALRNNCEVESSLGLPPVSPTQPQQVERVLRGLDVVERVVRLAVASGASKVEKIGISERGRRSTAGRPAQLDLTPVQLEVVFEGLSPTPFLRVLLAEAAQGRPLGLAGVEVSAPNPRRRERRVLLEFAVGVLPVAATEGAPQ
jgi:hypothetical protein